VTTVPPGPFTTISAGFAHVCGLRPDQTITCWGRNAEGQSTPPSGTFKQVSAGTFHSCGLRTDNTVVCWGNNAAGRVTPDLRNAPDFGAVGKPFTFTFATFYLSPAGTFTLAPGSAPLPPGLTLNPNGTITGTPLAAGTYPNITVQMTNGLSPVVSTTFAVTIAPFVAPACTQTITGDYAGPLTVASGQSVCVDSARIAGPVTVNPGGAIAITNSQVTQGITADAPSGFSLCGSAVSGPSSVPGRGVVVRNAGVPIVIGDAANGCAANRVAGDVIVDSNRVAVTVGNNTVSGTMTVVNNTGNAPVVKANTMSRGALVCSGNVPAPTNAGQANSAAGKTGQCAAL
jgi:hypothetical protein